ncbi:hypothetical protein BFL37_02940 [Clavibacter michiganensis]|uniref:Integral membrane protein n=2 Tax=Clavibacter michiganensis TaxID=28447 RepID=A0A251YS26_9MICO|nr:hypothetical protein BFL37_02940 [Clavibacter michiganensis]
MADGALTRTAGRPRGASESEAGPRAAGPRSRWPWWAGVLSVYAASRVLTSVLMLLAARTQIASPWGPASPSLLRFSTFWDTGWYRTILLHGYPEVLPVDDAGHVQPNAWAFMPVYPAVVRVVEAVTGASFEQAAVGVSVIAGAGAVLVLHRLLSRFLPASAVMTAVVLVCVAPLSPLFQIGYAESLSTLVLLTALLLLVDRRYGALVPVVVVLAFTRPLGAAFAFALVLHGIHRLRTADADPFPGSERLRVATAAVAAGAAALAWPAIAWIRTGSPTAYTDTELAWRSGYTGFRHLIPFEPWFDGAAFWVGGPAGVVAVVLVVVAFGGMLLLPAVRALGTDLRIWILAYGVYLLAVFFPQSSLFRLLLPMIPLAGALALPRSRAYRVALVLAAVAGQWIWIDVIWRMTTADWTPP